MHPAFWIIGGITLLGAALSGSGSSSRKGKKKQPSGSTTTAKSKPAVGRLPSHQQQSNASSGSHQRSYANSGTQQRSYANSGQHSSPNSIRDSQAELKAKLTEWQAAMDRMQATVESMSVRFDEAHKASDKHITWTTEELETVKLMVCDLIYDINDENHETLVNCIPEADRAEAVHQFESAKERYHLILSNFLVALGKALEEHSAELCGAVDSLRDDVKRTREKLQADKNTLTETFRSAKTEVSDNLQQLETSVSSAKEQFATEITSGMRDFNSAIDSAQTEIEAKIAGAQQSLELKITEVKQKVASLAELHKLFERVKVDLSQVADRVSSLTNQVGELESQAERAAHVLATVNTALEKSRANGALLLVLGALLGVIGNIVAAIVPRILPSLDGATSLGLFGTVLLVICVYAIVVHRTIRRIEIDGQRQNSIL